MKRGTMIGAGLAALAAGAALLRGKGNTAMVETSDEGRALPGSPPPGLRASEPHIAKLDPAIQGMARALLSEAWANGVSLVVTNGLRDMAEQARLYAQGRTAPGKIVTNAQPGSSWHNFGLAFDVAVYNDGHASWPNDVALWKRIGAFGKSVGLTWGGDFTTITDYPHFEYHPGMTLANARAGQRPPNPMV